MTYGQQLEEKGLPFTPKNNDSDRARHIFESINSHGANQRRLSQLCATWDFVMLQLGWSDVKLSNIVTGYQASIDARYHNDYKAIETIEELDRRMAMRRSSAYRQNDITKTD